MHEKANRKNNRRWGLRETVWMAVPGLAGAFLFLWGLKVFEWAGQVCFKGGVLVGIGSCLMIFSLYIYWRIDFRGRQGGGSFIGLFVSTIGTAMLVAILTRLITR